jgi:hypothetical protein
MKSLVWLKSKDGGYDLHKRNNVTWCTMRVNSSNTLTVLFRNKTFKKTFDSHKVAINISQIIAERLKLKSRLKEDDGIYNLPGEGWVIDDC